MKIKLIESFVPLQEITSYGIMYKAKKRISNDIFFSTN